MFIFVSNFFQICIIKKILCVTVILTELYINVFFTKIKLTKKDINIKITLNIYLYKKILINLVI